MDHSGLASDLLLARRTLVRKLGDLSDSESWPEFFEPNCPLIYNFPEIGSIHVIDNGARLTSFVANLFCGHPKRVPDSQRGVMPRSLPIPHLRFGRKLNAMTVGELSSIEL